MGCDKKAVKDNPNNPSFNPRTHMGCDELDRIIDRLVLVSIHAPTWGATICQ